MPVIKNVTNNLINKKITALSFPKNENPGEVDLGGGMQQRCEPTSPG
jgi:hypothetical protein